MQYENEAVERDGYVPVDRRRQPSRRAGWRGGRRDADWTNRPPGALARAESREYWFSAFSRWFVSRDSGLTNHQ
jgi:hypothetical protein